MSRIKYTTIGTPSPASLSEAGQLQGQHLLEGKHFCNLIGFRACKICGQHEMFLPALVPAAIPTLSLQSLDLELLMNNHMVILPSQWERLS